MDCIRHCIFCVIVVIILAFISESCQAHYTENCIFDQIKLNTSALNRCSLPYKTHDDDGRRIKRAHDHTYERIRINVQFHDLEAHLKENEIPRLRSVVIETVNKAMDIFRVVRVEGPLLLARATQEFCKTVLHTGINAGKCSSIKASYSGEYCLDNFKVPDAHLEGLYLWNSTHPDSVQEVYKPGYGLDNTDFVLYVRSLDTLTCINQGLNTVAYAAYCQVDQNYRPVAGYINFCPALIRDPHFDKDRATVTALHELFHALGFASDLFSRYQDCRIIDDHIDCDQRRNTVRYVDGAWRLTTPAVINRTSNHFGCVSHQTINEFGPILQTENGEVRSHWDAAFMQGSIMTPNIGLPQLTLLDPITLALFEDTGWYKVDYNYADMFMWGKASGCHFGKNPSCESDESRYFCSGKNQNGCHFLQSHKGTCKTDHFLHNCFVYKATPEDDCEHAENAQNNLEEKLSGQVYSSESSCFFANIIQAGSSTQNPGIRDLTGHCFLHYCNDSQLFVRVGTLDYHPCPYGKSIQVEGYDGIVQCPDHHLMCHLHEPYQPTESHEEHTTRRHLIPIPETEDSVICIDIYYGDADYELTSLNSVAFQDYNLKEILKWTSVSRRRLENFYLAQGPGVVFRFDLYPVIYSDDGPSTWEAYSVLEEVIHNRSFSFVIPTGARYIATGIQQRDSGPVEHNQELPVANIAGAAVGAVAGAIIIGVLVFVIQRHHHRVSDRRRAEERERRNQQEQQQIYLQALQNSRPSIPGPPRPGIVTPMPDLIYSRTQNMSEHSARDRSRSPDRGPPTRGILRDSHQRTPCDTTASVHSNQAFSENDCDISNAVGRNRLKAHHYCIPSSNDATPKLSCARDSDNCPGTSGNSQTNSELTAFSHNNDMNGQEDTVSVGSDSSESSSFFSSRTVTPMSAQEISVQVAS